MCSSLFMPIIWKSLSFFRNEFPLFIPNFISFNKLRERKVKTLTRNWRDHQRTGTHKLYRDISTGLAIFLNRKRVIFCEQVTKTASLESFSYFLLYIYVTFNMIQKYEIFIDTKFLCSIMFHFVLHCTNTSQLYWHEINITSPKILACLSFKPRISLILSQGMLFPKRIYFLSKKLRHVSKYFLLNKTLPFIIRPIEPLFLCFLYFPGVEN